MNLVVSVWLLTWRLLIVALKGIAIASNGRHLTLLLHLHGPALLLWPLHTYANIQARRQQPQSLRMLECWTSRSRSSGSQAGARMRYTCTDRITVPDMWWLLDVAYTFDCIAHPIVHPYVDNHSWRPLNAKLPGIACQTLNLLNPYCILSV